MSVLRKHMGSKPQWYKKAATDERLSFEAVGLLLFLLSQKEGWDVLTSSISRAGQSKTPQELCQELMSIGYLTRQVPNKRPPSTHISDVASEAWAKRNAASDWSSKPPSPHPTSYDELAGECGTAADVLALTDPDSAASIEAKADGSTAIAKRVLVEWADATGRDRARARMTGERLRKVEARLAEGFSESELVEAVRGIALSSWHMGDNPDGKQWNDMTLALRNGTNVEKFRDLYAQGGEEKLDASDRAAAILHEMGYA